MKIAQTIREVHECVKSWRTEGLTVGFVPTMGCLHERHQSWKRTAASAPLPAAAVYVGRTGQNVKR